MINRSHYELNFNLELDIYRSMKHMKQQIGAHFYKNVLKILVQLNGG